MAHPDGNNRLQSVASPEPSSAWIARPLCFYAHRAHLYQRLVIASQRHRHVTLPVLGLALAWVGGLALAWVGGLPGGALAAALLPPLCALLL